MHRSDLGLLESVCLSADLAIVRTRSSIHHRFSRRLRFLMEWDIQSISLKSILGDVGLQVAPPDTNVRLVKSRRQQQGIVGPLLIMAPNRRQERDAPSA
jgi:hypothetical protein